MTKAATYGELRQLMQATLAPLRCHLDLVASEHTRHLRDLDWEMHTLISSSYRQEVGQRAVIARVVLAYYLFLCKEMRKLLEETEAKRIKGGRKAALEVIGRREDAVQGLIALERQYHKDL